MFRNQRSIGNKSSLPGLIPTTAGTSARPDRLNLAPYPHQSHRGYPPNRGPSMSRGSSSAYFGGSSVRGARPPTPTSGAPYNGGAGQSNYGMNAVQGDAQSRSLSSSYGYGLSTMPQGGGDKSSQTYQKADQFMRFRNPPSRASTTRSQYFNPSARGGLGARQTSFGGGEPNDCTNDDFNHSDMPSPANYGSTSIPELPKPAVKATIQVNSEEEPSLRVLTVSPTILKKSNYKQHCTKTLFEVFGNLSSAVTKGTHSAVHFCIRSESDIIPCVFYEIDRPLGNMIRNQLYRCTGTYEGQSNMRCFSVRLATSTEKKYLNKLLNLANEP